MRVQIVDPPAYTPPYDHALAGALARAGAEVELITCHFPYGSVPERAGLPGPRALLPAKLASRASAPAGAACCGRRSTSPTCCRYRRVADRGGSRPLPVASDPGTRPPPASPEASARLHDALAPAGGRQPDRPLPHPAARRRWTRSSVHSEHGARRLEEDFGVPAERVRVIPHGAFTYLTEQDDLPLPPELQEVEGPVILAFGLIRPYKGTDVLLEAMQEGRGRRALDRRDAADADGRASRAGRPGARHGSLRRALHPRRRDPGLHAPRGPRRSAVPEHRAVRRPLHGARVRATAGAELGGWIPRDRRARRGAARPARGPRCAGRAR